jgi:hypothetical protein
MHRTGFDARQFILWAFGGIVTFCVIVTVAAFLTVAPWGGADDQLRQALPAAQGETTSEVGAKAP